MSAGRDMEIALATVGICPANGWHIECYLEADGGCVSVKHPERGLAFFIAAETKKSCWGLADNLVEQVKDLIVIHFAKGNVK